MHNNSNRLLGLEKSIILSVEARNEGLSRVQHVSLKHAFICLPLKIQNRDTINRKIVFFCVSQRKQEREKEKKEEEK
jgi:hypothetical protein